MLRILELVLSALALTLVASSCGGTDMHSLDSLTMVCEGQPHDVAAALDSQPVNKVQYLFDDGDGWEWDAYVGDSSSDWTGYITQEVALVVCLDVTASSVAAECEYEDGYTVTKFHSDYDVALREASTGAVVAETSVEAEIDTDCGMFVLASDGDAKHEDRYASPAPQLQEFLRPHVES